VGHNGHFYEVDRLLLGAETAHRDNGLGCYQVSGGQINEFQGPTLVSFVFVLFNQPVAAAKSILATFRTAHEIPSAEFVVFDDASTEHMGPVLTVLDSFNSLFGTRILRRRATQRMGFIAAANAALNLASGVYTCFIGPDVYPLPGWLALTYSTMRSYPGAGIVGPLQLSQAGRVAEAGNTLFRMGHAFAVGTDKWPWELPFVHAHVVDYISSACMMFERTEFLGLGLFDPRYKPAYLEDADAGLTMRRSGKLVVLQPLAAVVHVKSDAYHLESTQGLLDRNEERLLRKHGDSLDRHCPSPRGWAQTCSSQEDIDRAIYYNRIRRQGTQVLVVDFVVPEIDKDSGSLRLLELLNIMIRMGYGITLQSDSVLSNAKYVLPLLASGIHVLAPGTLKQMAAQLNSGEGRDKAICPWQVAIISRRAVFVAQGDVLKQICPNIPVIYDTVDLHFVRERRSVELARKAGATADKVFLGDGFVDVAKTPEEEVEALLKEGEELEVGFMRTSEFVLVVGSGEVDIASSRVGAQKVRLLTNIYQDPDRSETGTNWADRVGGLFVGSMCHTPNIDASKFIMREILKDHDMFPKGFMHLVWSGVERCSALIPGLIEEANKHPLITLHLDVSNAELHELHMKSKFFLGALRVGAGVKGKLCMALLYGLPIVGSDMATEGMFLEPETNVLSASTPKDYINQMKRVQDDEQLWNKLRHEGFSVIEKHFSRSAARNTLSEMFSHLGIAPRTKMGAGDQLRAEWVWDCPLPEDFQGRLGLFPGREDRDCWSMRKNPFLLPVPTVTFEDNFVSDHVPRPKRVRTPPGRCPTTSVPSVARPFMFHNIMNCGGNSIKQSAVDSTRQAGLVVAANCEGSMDCRCNTMYGTPLSQSATCIDSADFHGGAVFHGAFAPLPLERLHQTASNDKTCFIFLRSPLRRSVSHYYKFDVYKVYGNRHFHELKGAELEEAVRKTGGGDFMTKYLGCEDEEECSRPATQILQSAHEELRRCHVGITENFKSSVSYLAALAPWVTLPETIPAPARPEVYQTHKEFLANLSPQEQLQVQRWYEVDDILYEWGKDLFYRQARSLVRCITDRPTDANGSELLKRMRELVVGLRSEDQSRQWQVASCMERVVSCREGPLKDKCDCSEQELREAVEHANQHGDE
jgi:hypothetical protein